MWSKLFIQYNRIESLYYHFIQYTTKLIKTSLLVHNSNKGFTIRLTEPRVQTSFNISRTGASNIVVT